MLSDILKRLIFLDGYSADPAFMGYQYIFDPTKPSAKDPRPEHLRIWSLL